MRYTGYTDKIDSLKAYYRNNMNFLNSDIRRELFNPKNPIYTKTKDQSPTKYRGVTHLYRTALFQTVV